MYRLQILATPDSDTAGHLAASVSQSISEHGRWEHFVELRMGAGPTLAIDHVEGQIEALRATVHWGSQMAHVDVGTVDGAIEAADRLAQAFYEMRRDQPVL